MIQETPRRLLNLLAAEVDPAFAARAEQIIEDLIQERPARVLDIGCGRGFYLHVLSEFDFPESIHGVDVNPQYLELARRACKDPRVTVQRAVIEDLPFEDGYFDFVICSEVLEHLRDDTEGLRELRRVLRPGGTLVVSVPNYSFPFLWDPLNWVLMRLFHRHVPKDIWWLAGIWADHERLYTRQQIESTCERAGFAVVRCRGVVSHCLPFSHFLLYGIGKNLVERLGFSEFDRFNYQRGGMSRVAASVFRWPTRFDHASEDENSMDIVCKLSRA